MRRPKTLVIGITGSIGMGKSTAAKMFMACRCPSAPAFHLSGLSADQIVHDLYGPSGEATPKIAKLFPSVVDKRGVDRKKLAQEILGDHCKLKQIEDIIHPLVFKACRAFVAQEKKKGTCGVVLEIPLLFETGYNTKCDVTVCVSATALQQKERVLKRKGMTAQKLRALLKQQWSDRAKRQKADYVIRSDKGLVDMRRQVTDLCRSLFQERVKHDA